MTLLAFTAQRDRAGVLTDSHSYGAAGELYVVNRKQLVVPELPAVVSTKGPAELGNWWGEVIPQVLHRASDVDDLADLAEEYLPRIWQDIPDPTGSRRAAGRIVHVGWSSARDRFVAHQFQAASGFVREDLTDLPVSCAPSPLVLPASAPTTDEEWAALGLAAYRDCSLDPGLIMRDRQTYIGGELLLTELRPRQVCERVVATIPEHDWQHRQMLIGSLHLYGQAGPCVCGSGQPYLLCHLSLKTGRCQCGSGRDFRFCHRLTVADPAVREHWRLHVDDFYRTQSALAATWLEVRPGEPIPDTADVRRLFGMPAGVIPPRPTARPAAARNAPCPCGSGQKYKRCCGDPTRSS